MSDLKDKLAGKFIVIDGPDGSGKTTQLRLLQEHLHQQGLSFLYVIDPGSTVVGTKIREILLSREGRPLAPMCETMLFMASRAQLVHELIRPALAEKKVVLCDRFVSATVAYQGALGVKIDDIIELGNLVSGGLWPDLTIILDLPIEEGMNRIGTVRGRLKNLSDKGTAQRSLFGDQMESRSSAYHEEVRRIFKQLAKKYPSPVVNVDAMGSVDEVQGRVQKAIADWAA